VTPEGLRGLIQPDQRTCGPSSLVAAHLLLDPVYAGTLDRTGFATSVLELHGRLTSASAFGRAQLPWPRALGTPPWAVARAMSAFAGVPYRTHVVRWGSRTSAFSSVHAAVSAGRPCALYVGDVVPRHVVLAVAPTALGVQVYNPARGSLDELERADFEAGHLTTFGRWRRPWFVVAPAR
jgi:hypothetical protein